MRNCQRRCVFEGGIRQVNALKLSRFLRRSFNKKGLPVHFTFFVTAKCNSVCKTCFYWDNLNQSTNELTLEEIEKLVRTLGPLVWLAYTGGEPFLRKELPEISRVFYQHTQPAALSINTNGIRTEEIVRTAEKILAYMPKTFLAILVSIDGLGEVHDEIRGVPGNFKKAIETFRALQKIRERSNHMGVGISTTFNQMNQDHVFEMTEFVVGQLKPDNWDISFIRGTPMNPAIGAADIEKFKRIKKIAESAFLNKSLKYYDRLPLSRFLRAKERVVQQQLFRTLETGQYQRPCFAGALSAILTEEGNVYPCEILDARIGNIREVDYDFSALWNSPKAEEIRRRISENRCFCTHECNISVNTLFNIRAYPAILKEMTTSNIEVNLEREEGGGLSKITTAPTSVSLAEQTTRR